MLLALLILLFGLVAGLGFAAMMFWETVTNPRPLLFWLGWSGYGAATWTLFLLILVPEHDRWWALTGIIAGPLSAAYFTMRRRMVAPTTTLDKVNRSRSTVRSITDGH